MKKTYLILVGIMVLAFPGIVNALEIENCPEQIKIGEEVTIKLKETDDIVEGDIFKWTSANPSALTVNKKTEDNGKSAVIKGISEVSAISVTVATEDDSKSTSCQIKVVSNKSSDATLKSLAVDGFTLSPEFNKDTESYTVKVKSDTTKVKITGEATDGEKATVEGLDEVTLDKDKMTAEVKVTAEDGSTTKTYTIKFEIEEKVEVKAFTLDELEITGAEIDPKFDKNTFKYTLKVKDGETPKVKSYKSTDENAQVFVGEYDKNKGIVITVTDGSKSKKYEFLLPAKEYNVNLSKLEIAVYPFEEAFNKDVTRYTTTIPYEVEEVTLVAVAEDENATVTHTSLKNLRVGNNQITVTVKNGDKTKNYLIIVNRDEEEELAEKPTSIITTGKDKKDKNSDYDIPDVEKPDSTFNLIMVTVASIILFASGVVGIIFFIKTSPKRLKKEIFNKHEAKKSSPLVEAKAKSDDEVV